MGCAIDAQAQACGLPLEFSLSLSPRGGWMPPGYGQLKSTASIEPGSSSLVRITRARELLEDTTLSVSEIAGRTGYSESKYFIQVFGQQMGITPLQYRKKAKGSASRIP